MPVRHPFRLALVALALTTAVAAHESSPSAEEPVDWETVGRIRDEGFRRSKVLELARHLTEEIGPRLTGSPAMAAANEWTRQQLAEWGLENTAIEPWGTFGKSWTLERSQLHLIEPYFLPIPALPKAWTPGTGGKLRGELLRVKLETSEDRAQWKGKLAGKVILLDDAKAAQTAAEEPLIDRHDDTELAELCVYELPEPERPNRRDEMLKRWRFRREVRAFLIDEKVAATLEVSSREGTLLRVGGDPFAYEPEAKVGVPALVVSYEHYNRLVRLVERLGDNGSARVELQVEAELGDEAQVAANTVAEIPGSDLADELVLLGAHLDSWHGGTGATDNAAGVAMVMEAARILKVLGVKPRRTIRVVLWSGEEQGLLGSRAYVENHFARRPPSDEPDQRELPKNLRLPGGPWELLPDHAKVSAYFNLDNGGGKVRGIYAQENLGVMPIFSRWILPLGDLGVTTVTANPTGSTDHAAFDRAGLPGFQFIQDELDYGARTHHSTADVFDHLSEDDLMQGAVVLATFVHHAAQRDQRLPRKAPPRND